MSVNFKREAMGVADKSSIGGLKPRRTFFSNSHGLPCTFLALLACVAITEMPAKIMESAGLCEGVPLLLRGAN